MNKFFMMLFLCCAASGCATVNRMAIDKKATLVNVSSKSVLLISLDLSHQDSTYYVPRAMVVFVETPNAQKKEDRQNFRVDEEGMTSTKTGHNTYLLRMALTPGKYLLKGVFGDTGRFPFHGFFFVPLMMDIDVPEKAVVYQGRIEATLRPRKGDEFRAGSVIPLIDQAVTGVSGGTFDVSVKDLSETDLPLMRATFPALSKSEIKTIILPDFDRPKVQRWWASDGKNVAPSTTTPQSKTNP